MTQSLKRMAVLLTSLVLALGVASALSTAPAGAATACSKVDRQYGKTQVRVAQAKATKKKAAKRVSKAKRAYAKRDTAANRKKLQKARKVNRRAARNVRVWRGRNADARAAAARCQAPGAPSTPPQADQFQQILNQLSGLGLSPDQVQAIADQIAGALGGGMSPDTLLAVLEPVVDALSDAGLPVDQVVDAIEQLLGTLAGGDLPANPSGLLDVIIDSLQDALADTPLDQLNPILEQVQVGVGTLLGGLLGGGGLPLPLP